MHTVYQATEAGVTHQDENGAEGAPHEAPPQPHLAADHALDVAAELLQPVHPGDAQAHGHARDQQREAAQVLVHQLQKVHPALSHRHQDS